MNYIQILRERQGFTQKKEFAKVLGIDYQRYLLIEKMVIRATEAEFQIMGGTKYDEYCTELRAGRVLMSTELLSKFAISLGVEPSKAGDIVKNWVDKNK